MTDNAMTSTLQRSSARSIPRLALSATEAAEALGVSADFFAHHIAADLRLVRRGRKKLVSVRELERWLDENAALLFEEQS